MAEYTYDGSGRKQKVVYTTSKTDLLVPMGSIVPPQGTNISTTVERDYCGNMIYENGKLTKILIEGGYIDTSGSKMYYCYYMKDHLGSNRICSREDSLTVQKDSYYPFGVLQLDRRTTRFQSYKYNGKELDSMHGLDWYDYGARHYDATTGRWMCIDPMAEKYYDVSPYVYCKNNPVNRIDPDGMDWIGTNNGIYYNPKVKSQDDISLRHQKRGYKYLGETYVDEKQGISYRRDGSIMFDNETDAYNHIWNNANILYRSSKYPNGKEVGGFILANGKVLVMPDYLNDSNNARMYTGGYVLANGKLTNGKELFNVIGQVHTHQNKNSNPTPSYYMVDSLGDLGFSILNSSIPVFTIGHDGYIHGLRGYQDGSQNVVKFVELNNSDSSRANLLSGATTLSSIIRRLPRLK